MMDASKLNEQIVTCIAIKEAPILEIARDLVTSSPKIFMSRLDMYMHRIC